MATIVCSRNTVRESSYISFFCGGDPFCEVVQRLENTQGELTGLLEWLAGLSTSLEWRADLSPSPERPADLSLHLRDQQISPFAWETSRSLPFLWETSRSQPSVQNYRPYIVFSSPMQKYERPLCLTYCLFMAGYQNLNTSILFFSVICWSYMWTAISVILSTGNKLHFSLSCETTLLMLSCDRIESAKFIVTS